MHFETNATDFLEPVDGFIAAIGGAARPVANTIALDTADRSPGALRCTVLAGPTPLEPVVGRAVSGLRRPA
jgi:hypothetical protein